MLLTPNEITAVKFHYECILLSGQAGKEEESAVHWEALTNIATEDTAREIRLLGIQVALEMMNSEREKQGLPKKEYAVMGGKNA